MVKEWDFEAGILFFLNLKNSFNQLCLAIIGLFSVIQGVSLLVTDRSSVLPFCPNRTEQVNQSSVSQTEIEQNRTCKKRIKTYT
jgi:hypothetical protein